MSGLTGSREQTVPSQPSRDRWATRAPRSNSLERMLLAALVARAGLARSLHRPSRPRSPPSRTPNAPWPTSLPLANAKRASRDNPSSCRSLTNPQTLPSLPSVRLVSSPLSARLPARLPLASFLECTLTKSDLPTPPPQASSLRLSPQQRPPSRSTPPRATLPRPTRAGPARSSQQRPTRSSTRAGTTSATRTTASPRATPSSALPSFPAILEAWAHNMCAPPLCAGTCSACATRAPTP